MGCEIFEHESENKSESVSEYDVKVFIIHSERRSETYLGDPKEHSIVYGLSQIRPELGDSLRTN